MQIPRAYLFASFLLAICGAGYVSVAVPPTSEEPGEVFVPFGLEPVDPLEVEADLVRALGRDTPRSDSAPPVPLTFDEHAPLALEDLYLEAWHGGGGEAVSLMNAVRDCDVRAAMRFGRTRRIRRAELDPPAAWPLELRYRAGDPRGREAAELLLEHLRGGCEGAARETILCIVSRSGLVLCPVPTLRVEDAGARIPLVLVHGATRR